MDISIYFFDNILIRLLKIPLGWKMDISFLRDDVFAFFARGWPSNFRFQGMFVWGMEKKSRLFLPGFLKH